MRIVQQQKNLRHHKILLTFFLMQLLIRKQQESAPLHGLQHSLAEKNPERRKSRAGKAHERERARADCERRKKRFMRSSRKEATSLRRRMNPWIPPFSSTKSRSDVDNWNLILQYTYFIPYIPLLSPHVAWPVGRVFLTGIYSPWSVPQC
jgi:hypothetical protein